MFGCVMTNNPKNFRNLDSDNKTWGVVEESNLLS